LQEACSRFRQAPNCITSSTGDSTRHRPYVHAEDLRRDRTRAVAAAELGRTNRPAPWACALVDLALAWALL